MGMHIMDIKALIDEHTAALHKLAYEKLTLLDRCAAIENDMGGLTGVINALKYVEVENGTVQHKHEYAARDSLGEGISQSQPEPDGEQSTDADADATGATVVHR